MLTTASTRPTEWEFQRSDVMIGPPEQLGRRRSRMIRLLAGARIEDRLSWTDLTLTVISGHCRIETESEHCTLRATEQREISANQLHTIVALCPTRAVLTFDAAVQPLRP